MRNDECGLRNEKNEQKNAPISNPQYPNCQEEHTMNNQSEIGSSAIDLIRDRRSSDKNEGANRGI